MWWRTHWLKNIWNSVHHCSLGRTVHGTVCQLSSRECKKHVKHGKPYEKYTKKDYFTYTFCFEGSISRGYSIKVSIGWSSGPFVFWVVLLSFVPTQHSHLVPVISQKTGRWGYGSGSGKASMTKRNGEMGGGPGSARPPKITTVLRWSVEMGTGPCCHPCCRGSQDRCTNSTRTQKHWGQTRLSSSITYMSAHTDRHTQACIYFYLGVLGWCTGSKVTPPLHTLFHDTLCNTQGMCFGIG